ncbi:MAG: undecaprenyl/decaprenyl-phosphate alpha-N-acetylglucosaminyl 1-phosphate transferase [Clostridiales Family XIII bacterium]|jgi:UDP-GlcNAc:undecaprenyl-phosphate GlcNAc-1-phosphate transferase|nr:undecaprenyl/decaprenyl-phosphate alpha-N-acetylglucosaminyl 1-phosphate transferase [Clostridiales Family XIII bacterium]
MSDLAILRIAIAGCLAASLLISFALTPLSMRIAGRIGAVDIPKDDRRMHKIPIPRFGGFAIFLAAFVVILLVRFVLFRYLPYSESYDEPVEKLTGVLAGGLLIYLLGVFDDIFTLSPVIKLFGQIICATATFILDVRIPAFDVIGLEFSSESFWGIALSYIVTLLWIVAITNMVNLVDGLDGLAAGVSVIAALSIAYSAYIHGQYTVTLAMLAVAGAAAGFLPFNFHPAKTFMGDGGALFLGFMIGSISVIGPAKGPTVVASIVPLFVLGVPIFDTLFAIFRRKTGGRPIFSADKGHLHHQLSYIGMGQRRSVMMIYGISSVMGIAAIVFSRRLYLEAVALFLTAVIFLFVLIWGWNDHSKKS